MAAPLSTCVSKPEARDRVLPCMVSSAQLPSHVWGEMSTYPDQELREELGALALMRFCFQDCFDVVNRRRKTSAPEAWLAWSVTIVYSLQNILFMT